MTTFILIAVVIVAAVVVARMVFSREDGGAAPQLPEEPSLSAPPSFVPRVQRQRGAPAPFSGPPSSILGLPTDTPRPGSQDDEWELFQQLLERVGDRARVDRMLEFERMSWPLATRREWIIRAQQRLDIQEQR